MAYNFTGCLKYLLIILLFTPVISFSQNKQVSIRIQQDESFLLDSFETHIVLQKKAFKIQVMLENIEGVYCYAAFDDSIYRLTENMPVPDFAYLPDMAMAEEEFNKEKELIINPEGWSYWFYDSKLNWHRFNKKIILLDSNRVVGIKSVKQFYLLPDQKDIKPKDIHKSLYLFFVAVAEENDKHKPARELMRRKVRIDWINED